MLVWCEFSTLEKKKGSPCLVSSTYVTPTAFTIFNGIVQIFFYVQHIHQNNFSNLSMNQFCWFWKKIFYTNVPTRMMLRSWYQQIGLCRIFKKFVNKCTTRGLWRNLNKCIIKIQEICTCYSFEEGVRAKTTTVQLQNVNTWKFAKNSTSPTSVMG